MFYKCGYGPLGVLPTVYNDELSYYELLNKIIYDLQKLQNTVTQNSYNINSLLAVVPGIESNATDAADKANQALEIANNLNAQVAANTASIVGLNTRVTALEGKLDVTLDAIYTLLAEVVS